MHSISSLVMSHLLNKAQCQSVRRGRCSVAEAHNTPTHQPPTQHKQQQQKIKPARIRHALSLFPVSSQLHRIDTSFCFAFRCICTLVRGLDTTSFGAHAAALPLSQNLFWLSFVCVLKKLAQHHPSSARTNRATVCVCWLFAICICVHLFTVHKSEARRKPPTTTDVTKHVDRRNLGARE